GAARPVHHRVRAVHPAVRRRVLAAVPDGRLTAAPPRRHHLHPGLRPLPARADRARAAVDARRDGAGAGPRAHADARRTARRRRRLDTCHRDHRPGRGTRASRRARGRRGGGDRLPCAAARRRAHPAPGHLSERGPGAVPRPVLPVRRRRCGRPVPGRRGEHRGPLVPDRRPTADERALHGTARAGARGCRRDAVPAMSGRAPLPGTRVRIALTDRPVDEAVVRVIAAPQRDMTHGGRLSPALAPFADALLVDVAAAGTTVLPGAWVEHEVLERGAPIAPVPVTAADLRPPAVIMGSTERAALCWGETVWPLDLGGVVASPDAARPGPPPLSRLPRLLLVALGRRSESALTLWQAPGLGIRWQDVRLRPHAQGWFELAGVPPGTRYADAERIQGVGRARPWS